jgi:hypothetical protein
MFLISTILQDVVDSDKADITKEHVSGHNLMSAYSS